MHWSEKESAIGQLCMASIADKIFPGCVIGIERNGSRSVYAFGRDDYDGAGMPMDRERVFDIASLTKVMPVSTLALMEIAAGRLKLNDPVAQYIPAFAAHHDNQATVFHLLTHSLDYRFPLSSLRDLPADELFQRLCAHPFAAEPGSLFNYGNACSILLGKVLEASTGMPLADLARQRIFTPLGMRVSGWNPLMRVAVERIVPTEECPWRKRTMRGEIHDESAYAMRSQGPVGSAGMFSCIDEILDFVAWFKTRSDLVEMASTNQLAHLPGICTGLGWELANRRFMGELCGARTFGKTGFTGQSIVCDPDRNTTIVLLTAFTWPRREKTPDRIYTVRAQLADLVFG